METVAKRKRKDNRTPEQKVERHQRQRMRNRAAILSICPLGNNTYQVWGGVDTHVVRVTGGQVLCDCKGWENARHHVCSHVMKWRLVYGDLKK